MPKTRRKVNIIGHRNPDTDSICSALAYTYLKNQLGDAVYEARRAGQINRETAFVLKHFGVEPPRLCTDVSPQVKDIDIREQPGIDKEMSIRAAWSMMRDTEIDTLCAIDEDKELLGLITVKDIANANMDLFDTEVLAKSKTSYKNVLSTLEGEMLLGDPDACITSGRIFIGTSPEIMDGAVNPGDIVLVSNRYEVQMCAIDCGAGAIVVCCGSAVPRTILARAQEKGCIVITTPFDTYAAARLISTAAPVRHFMRSKNLLEFSVNTAVEDARKVMANVRHRYFPILDANGKYCGVISRRNLLNVHRKQVIMVDHNERGQAVDGLEQAEILEIIDHHRLADIQTTNPITVRNEPVGSTNTIIASMFQDRGLMPSEKMAGMMAAAILSDTVMFKSPTCTSRDIRTAERMARLANVSLDELGRTIFSASLGNKSVEELLFTDYKEFHIAGHDLAVAQITCMDSPSMLKRKDEFLARMRKVAQDKGFSAVLLMLTDVLLEGTQLIYVGDDETIRHWLKTFCRRFFQQQFKRSCLPDGPKVGSVSLSPRGDWRMPSDASAAMWLKECEEL